MNDINDDINDYNPKRKMKILIVFDDMISHVMPDKKAQSALKKLFIRCRKLNILLCFLTQSYFFIPKDVRSNCTHYMIFKVNTNRELQSIAINHSADIDNNEFQKIYSNCPKEPYNFLTINTKSPINVRFKKNFSK